MASRPFRAVAPVVFPPMHRFIVRVTGGRTMLDTRAQPMLLLRTTGARSGQRRETPLAVVPRPDGRLVVVGSNFARETHPAWTVNLLADPNAEVVYQGRQFPVTARLLSDSERSDLWPELLEWYPGWDDYVRITDRPFRIFELAPTTPN
jgi:deazaflavin-dependent oxidoreductase (nitroreductase family)